MSKKTLCIIGLILLVLILAVLLWSHERSQPPTASTTTSVTSTTPQPAPRTTISRTNTYAINLPNALILVDSQGRRTGKDPATGILYREIPGASYSEDTISPGHGSGQLVLSNPAAGNYTLYVLGKETGQYHLDAWIDDGGPNPPVPQRITGNIEADSMISYTQDYDIAHIASSTLVFGAVSLLLRWHLGRFG